MDGTDVQESATFNQENQIIEPPVVSQEQEIISLETDIFTTVECQDEMSSIYTNEETMEAVKYITSYEERANVERTPLRSPRMSSSTDESWSGALTLLNNNQTSPVEEVKMENIKFFVYLIFDWLILTLAIIHEYLMHFLLN